MTRRVNARLFYLGNSAVILLRYPNADILEPLKKDKVETVIPMTAKDSVFSRCKQIVDRL